MIYITLLKWCFQIEDGNISFIEGQRHLGMGESGNTSLMRNSITPPDLIPIDESIAPAKTPSTISPFGTRIVLRSVQTAANVSTRATPPSIIFLTSPSLPPIIARKNLCCPWPFQFLSSLSAFHKVLLSSFRIYTKKSIFFYLCNSPFLYVIATSQ